MLCGMRRLIVARGLKQEDTDARKSGWLERTEQHHLTRQTRSLTEEEERETKDHPVLGRASRVFANFMDKFSIWQLVPLIHTLRVEPTHGTRHKNERDRVQKFCELNLFELTCIRNKTDRSRDIIPQFSSPPFIINYHNRTAYHKHHAHARTSCPSPRNTTRSMSQAQDNALRRAWKGKDWLTTAVSQTDSKVLVATTKRVIGLADFQLQFQSQFCAVQLIPLVAAMPVKPMQRRSAAKGGFSLRGGFSEHRGRTRPPPQIYAAGSINQNQLADRE
ncbi:hypothetical protein EDB19DRAFT_1826657 [Suillus lakei]|nr:hypothetical protein EDB19DRAFT_1826657 [Suillus lakei]